MQRTDLQTYQRQSEIAQVVLGEDAELLGASFFPPKSTGGD